MIKAAAHTKHDLYKTELTTPIGNMLIADEPLDKGGKALGFSPKELLCAALASCTSITLRMYADHKQWDLQEIKVDVEMDRDDKNNTTAITRKLEFIGNLDDEQRKRLTQVANSCPVHKILSGSVETQTEVI